MVGRIDHLKSVNIRYAERSYLYNMLSADTYTHIPLVFLLLCLCTANSADDLKFYVQTGLTITRYKSRELAHSLNTPTIIFTNCSRREGAVVCLNVILVTITRTIQYGCAKQEDKSTSYSTIGVVYHRFRLYCLFSDVRLNVCIRVFWYILYTLSCLIPGDLSLRSSFHACAHMYKTRKTSAP